MSCGKIRISEGLCGPTHEALWVVTHIASPLNDSSCPEAFLSRWLTFLASLFSSVGLLSQFLAVAPQGHTSWLFRASFSKGWVELSHSSCTACKMSSMRMMAGSVVSSNINPHDLYYGFKGLWELQWLNTKMHPKISILWTLLQQMTQKLSSQMKDL